ncbi:unnamed protein product [Calypogeia fissa]
MPSGPKKRLRARRKKQGSPATDANSDRETEALSVTGSVDVDDLESGLDTPVKQSTRPAFLDKDAVSSQTDEWVRVSNFDVGTPTSQTEENDPSAEDGDVGSSRRSLDKLAEWETVSGEHIPGRQEGSINSLEEEPSECEVASAHSSESYTNLPSPHVAEREKDGGDSSDSDGKNRTANRSGPFSGTEEERAPASTEETVDSSAVVDVGEDISSARQEPPLPTAEEGQIEEIGRLHDESVKANRVDEAHKKEEEEDVPTASSESAVVATESDDQGMKSANGEGMTPSLKELGGQEGAVAASPVDVDDAEVSKDEKVASPAIDDSTAADDKEVASTSAKAEDEKSTDDASNFEAATSVENNSLDPQELAADSVSEKEVPTSGTSEPMTLTEETDLPISTPAEKNGTEKPQLEAKSSTGCCGVLYWLLGWDH